MKAKMIKRPDLRDGKYVDFTYTLSIDVSQWKTKDLTQRNIRGLHDEIHRTVGQSLADNFSDGTAPVYMRDCETGQFKGSAMANKDILDRIMDKRSRYLMIENCQDCPHTTCRGFTPVCSLTGRFVHDTSRIPKSCPLPNYSKLTGWE